MLNDSIGRVKVPIRAAYGTDPRQVEKILIDIACAHSMVITSSPNIDSPWVLFKDFGDSALLFELRAFITDIDCKMMVMSDINYSIAEAFHLAGIIIPFPQTDLHFRSSDIAGLNPAK